jgi:hypothetical protein
VAVFSVPSSLRQRYEPAGPAAAGKIQKLAKTKKNDRNRQTQLKYSVGREHSN